jgi:hypothetical protein
MGGICTLAFEKQEWSFVSFLVCIPVFDMYYCIEYLFCFWLSLLLFEYWTVFLAYAYPDWDIFAYAYKYFCMLYYSLGLTYFDWYVFVLLFYNCGCVLTLYLNQRSRYFKVIIIDIIFNSKARRVDVVW